MLLSLFVGGHSIITGVPGLAKTLLVRTIASVLDLSFKRIQFTPDLMPADITGTEIIEEDRATGRRSMEFIRGPVFANIVLADEINRTPPKTQAALLEAMQEGRVTVQGVSYDLPRPFHVLATQNPIEMEGTYPLPEAQLDRFMFQITHRLPPRRGRGGGRQADDLAAGLRVRALMSADEIIAFQRLVRQVPVSDTVARYAVRLVGASRPGSEGAPDFVNRWVTWGASLRASQFLVLGGQGARHPARSLQRLVRGRARGRARRPAPPHSAQLSGGGRACGLRSGHPEADRGRAGAEVEAVVKAVRSCRVVEA